MKSKSICIGCLCWILMVSGVYFWFSHRAKEPGETAPAYEFKESDVEALRLESCQLLKELYSFRYDREFHKTGFGAEGRHNDWLLKVQNAHRLASQLPARYAELKIVPGQILQIGLEFSKSRGKETAYTELLIPEVEKTIGYDRFKKSSAPKAE